MLSIHRVPNYLLVGQKIRISFFAKQELIRRLYGPFIFIVPARGFPFSIYFSARFERTSSEDSTSPGCRIKDSPPRYGISVSCCAAKFNASSFAANWDRLAASGSRGSPSPSLSPTNQVEPEMTGLQSGNCQSTSNSAARGQFSIRRRRWSGDARA